MPQLDSRIASRRRRNLVTLVVGVASALAVAACHSNDSTGVVTVSSVTVSAPATTLAAGGTLQLTSVTKDVNGTTLTGRTVTYSTSSSATATVSGTGLVTGVAAGPVTITATSEGRTGTIALTVTPAPVATVTVSGASSSVVRGSTLQLSAVTKDAAGNTLTGRTVTWSSSANTVATVDATGLVTGVAGGSATITATSEGQSGTMAITVTIPVSTIAITPAAPTPFYVGRNFQFSAVTKDVDNNTLTGRTINWTSSATSVATVDNTGKVTAVGVGSSTITAESEGKTTTVVVAVTLAPVSTVTVTPNPQTVSVNSTVTYVATLKDADLNTVTGRTVTWGSSDNTVATVSSTGVVTGHAVGSATITATSEGKSGSAVVNVRAQVSSVDVVPTSASILIGGTFALSAIPRDASNAALTGRNVAWTSENTAIATVDGNGNVLGVTPGVVIVHATIEGVVGSSTITVQQPVNSITITPNTATVPIGTTTTLNIVLKDINNVVLTGRTVTFSSSNTAVATVNGGGVVLGVASGTATITVTSEGKTATMTVTVP